MKELIIKLIDYVETKREANPRLFKVLIIGLWFIAPLEMACIKLGIFGYNKIKQYNKSSLDRLK